MLVLQRMRNGREEDIERPRPDHLAQLPASCAFRRGGESHGQPAHLFHGGDRVDGHIALEDVGEEEEDAAAQVAQRRGSESMTWHCKGYARVGGRWRDGRGGPRFSENSGREP